MNANETALSLDDTIRAEGQPMGRFIWRDHRNSWLSNHEGDWYPDPTGTHDGFIWRMGFYTLPHREQAS